MPGAPMSRLLLCGGAIFSLGLLLGCGARPPPAPTPPAAPPRPVEVRGDCASVVDLEGASPSLRRRLETALERRRVVAVRREDCEMPALLATCQGPSWVFLSEGKGGIYRGPPTTRAGLSGLGCGRATHVVRAVRMAGTCATPHWRPQPACQAPVALVLQALTGESDERDAPIVFSAAKMRWGAPKLVSVTLSGFSIDRNEVTIGRYRSCVEAGACSPPLTHDPATRETNPGCLYGRDELDKHPVNCVSWSQAAAFCAHAGGRLPTEAEWTRAARGPEARPYVWGEDWPPPEGTGNFADVTARTVHPHWAVLELVDGFSDVAPVWAGLDESPEGVRNLAGNVREWVADIWGPALGGGRDPKGPSRGRYRVVRGASFGQSRQEELSASARSGYHPDSRSAHIGFRCAYED